jgi:hypothetical protein
VRLRLVKSKTAWARELTSPRCGVEARRLAKLELKQRHGERKPRGGAKDGNPLLRRGHDDLPIHFVVHAIPLAAGGTRGGVRFETFDVRLRRSRVGGLSMERATLVA